VFVVFSMVLLVFVSVCVVLCDVVVIVVVCDVVVCLVPFFLAHIREAM
jgi:hypothetical protein